MPKLDATNPEGVKHEGQKAEAAKPETLTPEDKKPDVKKDEPNPDAEWLRQAAAKHGNADKVEAAKSNAAAKPEAAVRMQPRKTPRRPRWSWRRKSTSG